MFGHFYKTIIYQVAVHKLYQRLLATPTNGLSRNYEAFSTWLKGQNPRDLLDTAEFLQARKEVLAASLDQSEQEEEGGAAPGENAESDLMSDKAALSTQLHNL